MEAIQLHLWEEVSEVDILKAEVIRLRNELANVRRGLFQRHTEMQKELIRLQQQQELIMMKVAK